MEFSVVFKHIGNQARSGVEESGCIVCCKFHPVCEFSVSSRSPHHLNVSLIFVDLKM